MPKKRKNTLRRIQITARLRAVASNSQRLIIIPHEYMDIKVK
jgi:hypothetical protein